MRFPKPAFDDLVANYKTDPESVHDCPRIYTKNPININTCAIRITEALVLANHLIESRVKIAGLTTKGGTGKGFLLGNYGYRANLCPHGIGRGATDVGYFLTEHWGKPNHTWLAPGEPPKEIDGLTGVLCFAKIPGYSGQGHMDVWNKTDAVGHAYWDSQKVFFWKLA
ncbi:MAG: T6SS effector amidase Tae4 family protein [Polyangiaceae bacterium]